jgi:hypothetical protein
LSWFFELQLSAVFRREVEVAWHLEQQSLDDLSNELAPCKTGKTGKTAEENESLLRHVYPTIYFALLKSMGRTEELNDLFDGYITPENYTWYIHGELFPKLNQLRLDGRLQKGEKVKFSNHFYIDQKKTIVINGDDSEYSGETDSNGKACGNGIA